MTDYIALQNKQSGRQKRRISYFVFPLLFFGGVYLLHKKNGRRKGDATTVNKKKVELKYNSFYVIFNPNRSLGFLGAVWQREIL